MKTCYSYTEAGDEADKIHAARKKALETEAPTCDAAMTLAQAFTLYLDETVRNRSHRQDELTAKHLQAHFGPETRLRAITAPRIAAYKASRLAATSVRRKDADGKPTLLSNASINRPLALLRRLLNRAHSDDWGKVLAEVPKIKLEKEKPRLRFLSDDEAVRLLDACATSPSRSLLPIVRVALETGMRKSEILDLEWGRVDFSRGVLRLEITKSDKRREVPMRQAVYDILTALPEPHQGRVFPKASIRVAFENAVEAAKLDNFHFHNLRHTFASWFVMDGGSLQVLAEILGHADHEDLTITLRYAHLSQGHLRAEMERTARVPNALPQRPTQTERTDRRRKQTLK